MSHEIYILSLKGKIRSDHRMNPLNDNLKKSSGEELSDTHIWL